MKTTRTGRPRLASKIGDNALLKLAPLIERLGEQPPPEPTAEGLEFLSALYGESFEGPEGVERGLERLRSEQPLLATFLGEPMLGATLTPTKTKAGEKANVIPSSAEVLVDCRVPPGMDAECGAAADRIRAR